MDYEEQALEFLDKAGATISFERMDEPRSDGFSCGGYDYKVTIKRDNRTWTFEFSDSENNKRKNIMPTAYDVLACLQKYDVGTFEDFCGNYGYDNDSIKSLKTYKAVKKEYENVIKMFGDVMNELEEFN
jgi:hypothetical protein